VKLTAGEDFKKFLDTKLSTEFLDKFKENDWSFEKI
jgi:hypothetical protein